MTDSKLLNIYLADHLAGANVGRELAKRCLSNNKGTELGDYLENRLIPAIRSDKETLERIMDSIGAPRAQWKQAGALVAERVGRLKLNGQIRGYSPLSRLLELEGLCLGIEGKLSLWRALASLPDPGGRFTRFDLAGLIDSAARQREGAESFRLQAAKTALG